MHDIIPISRKMFRDAQVAFINIIKCSYSFFYRMNHYALCLSYHSNTERSCMQSCRLLGLKMALVGFLKGYATRYRIEVDPRFRNLSITFIVIFGVSLEWLASG